MGKNTIKWYFQFPENIDILYENVSTSKTDKLRMLSNYIFPAKF